VDEVIAAGIEQGADNKTIKASINFLLTESDVNIILALDDVFAALNIARINESNNIRHINAQPVITPRAQVAYA
jgi:hypothetical protein